MSETNYKTLYNSVITDFINIFDKSTPGNTTTGFKSAAYNKDLGQIFTPFVYDPITTGYKTSNGTDLGSLFARKNRLFTFLADGAYSIDYSNKFYNTVITFTGNGNITFNGIPPTSNSVLLVGAGGDGGDSGSGGGGGGGVGVGSISFIEKITYNIVVGIGGTNDSSDNGRPSTISKEFTIIETAYGGGHGGKTYANDLWSGGDGGSGGGGTWSNDINRAVLGGKAYKGFGNLTYYGNDGGTTTKYSGGGGGGGATQNGSNGYQDPTNSNRGNGGAGGNGFYFDLTKKYYGGGGGGSGAVTSGAGGSGGGGVGGTFYVSPGNGETNSGGGGGGLDVTKDGDFRSKGGSGVCIIAFNS
jgi:fibronectin-binding autotransporter adhesin